MNLARKTRSGGRSIASAAMSTCVVTGGAGFLGSHLCEHLLGEGHKVICIDNLETGSLQNIEHIRDGDFDFRHIDIIEHVDIPEAVDFVYHLASPASPIDLLAPAIPTLKVGSLGTHNTLGLAKGKNARYLLARTSEVYGDPEGIRSARTTGAMSIRSASGASTTRQNVLRRQ